MAYTFQTLNNNADPTFNQLLAINDEGTIAGYFGNGLTPAHPNKGYTLAPPYGQGNYTNENFPTSVQTQVTGINNLRVTVGFWVDGAGDNLGFVDRNNSFTTALDPNAPPLGGATPTTEQFLGINDFGKVAGFYNDAGGNAHGFIYNFGNGNFSPVNVAGATAVTATDINDRGQISGFYVNGAGVTDGFVDIKGNVTTLTGPTGATSAQALGLNNFGQVVGSFVDAGGNTDGFVYDMAQKTYTTIVDPNANGMTVVNGVNDLGQLAGFYLDAAGNTDGMLVTPHATGGASKLSFADIARDLIPSFRRARAPRCRRPSARARRRGEARRAASPPMWRPCCLPGSTRRIRRRRFKLTGSALARQG